MLLTRTLVVSGLVAGLSQYLSVAVA